VQDGKVSIEKNRVDGVAHEPGMDRVRRPEQEAFAFAERPSSEQAAKTCERVVGDDASLASDPPVHVFECHFHLVPHVDVVVVVPEREGRSA
jgi:hypothetical protein